MSEARFPEYLEYRTPAGEVFSFEGYAKFLMTEEGFGMPEIEYITQRGPFQHGDSILDYRLAPRILQLTYSEKSYSRHDYWDVRAGLLDIFRPNNHNLGDFGPGTLTKFLPNGQKRAIDVFPIQGPTFTISRQGDWRETTVMDTLRFKAPDPVFYDPNQQNTLWVLATQEHLVFPITFPIRFGTLVIDDTITVNYQGNWKDYPIITIIGPLEGAIIQNQSTGEEIRLLYTISAGETINIILQYGRKTVTSDIAGNLIGTVVGDLATFHIAPSPEVANGNNVIRVTGGSATPATQISICWYNRYIGI